MLLREGVPYVLLEHVGFSIFLSTAGLRCSVVSRGDSPSLDSHHSRATSRPLQPLHRPPSGQHRWARGSTRWWARSQGLPSRLQTGNHDVRGKVLTVLGAQVEGNSELSADKGVTAPKSHLNRESISIFILYKRQQASTWLQTREYTKLKRNKNVRTKKTGNLKANLKTKTRNKP